MCAVFERKSGASVNMESGTGERHLTPYGGVRLARRAGIHASDAFGASHLCEQAREKNPTVLQSRGRVLISISVSLFCL